MKVLKEKGITLVALVVTIIILLILAGVAIAQIGGNNGLFSRVRQATEQYKNASLDEEGSLKEIEKYLSGFEILGGDKTDEGVKVKIINFEANQEGKNIKAVVTIEGTASKIEYSLDGEEWVRDNDNEKNTEYIFKEVKIGSYNVRVRVYDEEEKKAEAMSKLITVVDTDIEIAKDEEVLKGKKYYDGNRNLNTGKMENRGNLNLTVPAEGSLPLPAGYYDAGTITASKGNIEFGSVTDVIESGQINFSNVPGSGQTFTVNFTNEYTAEDKAFIDVWSCSLSNCTTAWVFYTVQDGPFIIGKSKQVTVQAYRPTDKVSGFCYYRVKKYS